MSWDVCMERREITGQLLARPKSVRQMPKVPTILFALTLTRAMQERWTSCVDFNFCSSPLIIVGNGNFSPPIDPRTMTMDLVRQAR